MKKLILLNLMLLLVSWSIIAQTATPPLGDGSVSNPYEIATFENLYWITATDVVVASPSQSVRFAAHYIQTANIVASTTDGGWIPIGNMDASFGGTYDGQGHTISGLHVANYGSMGYGLFGSALGATFKNLGITNVDINGVNGNSGGLVGIAIDVTINNCYSTGSIILDAEDFIAGGLVGQQYYSTMINCYSSCNLRVLGIVGGLVGENNNSTIIYSYYSNGTVDGSQNSRSRTGGLVGLNQNSASISKCYSTGTVNGWNQIGGLVGVNDNNSMISDCYSRSNCSSKTDYGLYGGGLVGLNGNNSTITNCYSTGLVSELMSGLVGYQYVGGTTVNSYWDTQTSGKDYSNGGTGKTTTEMQNQSTFTGWDFATIWGINADINDGYPNLQALAPTCSNATLELTYGSNIQTVCANTAIEWIRYTLSTGNMDSEGASISPALPPGLAGQYEWEERIYTIWGTPTVAGVYTYTITTIGTSFPCTEATATGTITVNPSFTPTVTLTSTDIDNKICDGTLITFTATPDNTGGGTVAYVWNYRGYKYPDWGSSWTTDELEDGYAVSCEITVTGGTCLTSPTAVSNEIITNVYDPTLLPLITITSNASGEICDGTGVTFTATPENTGGGTVSYQWFKNDNSIGGNVDTYWSDELHDGDKVNCLMTVEGAACFEGVMVAMSEEIFIDVLPIVEATITSSDEDNSICAGTSVTFTPKLLNYIDGTLAYFWYKLHQDEEPLFVSDENTYTTTSLVDGDEIICEITVTGGTCPETTSYSNMITVRVNQCSSGQDDCFEPNNTLANASLITVDAHEIFGNILNAKDLDWFKFTTADAGYYTINFNPNGGKESVELCNSKGQKLRSGSKTTLTYNLLANTTYYIKLYDAKLKVPSPCYSLSVGYSLTMLTDGFVEENIDLKSVQIEPISDGICKIWPNPTKNEFQFYNGNEIPVQVSVMDVTGRRIEIIKNVGIAKTAVFGSKFNPGIYFVETFGNGAPKVFKLIKQ